MSLSTVNPSPLWYEEDGRTDDQPLSSGIEGLERFVTAKPARIPFLRFWIGSLAILVTGGTLVSLAYLNHQLVDKVLWVRTVLSWGAQFALAYSSIIALMLIGVVALGMVGLIGLSLYIVEELIRPVRSRPHSQADFAGLGLPAESIEFPSSDGSHQVRGFYIPREHARSTVLISPGYRRPVRDVLTACQHLWNAGHTILAFEYYGHGMAVGTSITLGYREVNDFLGAVTYVKQRAPETRLGALGYSMGGAVSILAAAQAPDVEAICADSAFASHWRAVEMSVHRVLRVSRYLPSWIIGSLRYITDTVLWLRAGYRFHQVEPVRAIQCLSPRPVLLIHGLEDTIVSPQDAKLLYQACGAPKALWYFPKADHLKAYFVDSAAYVARICAFFDRALLGEEERLLLVLQL